MEIDLKKFIEKSLNEVKIFCDNILLDSDYHKRDLLLYQLCPFQNISYDELKNNLDIFGIKNIGEFIYALAHYLKYNEKELKIIQDTMIKSGFNNYVEDHLKEGLFVQKRFQNNENGNNTGIKAEIFAYNYEKEKLINWGRYDLANNMMWPSRYIGDIFGYDILSHNLNNEEKLIEVKGTEKENNRFNLSFNEYRLLYNNNLIYYIYHVDLKNKIIYEITKKDDKIIDQFDNIYEEKEQQFIKKK